MVKPGYFSDTGKVSFTQPAQKISFCRGFTCCQDIPDTFTLLIQFEAGSSGSEYVFHCTSITMTKDDATTWKGTMTAVADCIDNGAGGDIDFEFTCDDISPLDPTDCTQVFAWTVGGNSITEDNCCCFDSDPDVSVKVDAGPFCLVGGFSPLWANARDGDGTGCNCTTWLAADATNGSIPIIWGYDVDSYGDACCQPSPCPDACCPSNPCISAEFMGGEPETLPEDVAGWLNDLTTE